MNEILISLITSISTCIVTISCFYLKTKMSSKKSNSDFLELISKEKIKHFKVYVERDDISSNMKYESKGSAHKKQNPAISIDVITEDGSQLKKQDMEKVINYFNLIKKGGI